MDCPKCPGKRLEPVSTEESLIGLGSVPRRCAGCGGLWVSRAAVPALHESGVLEAQQADAEADPEADRRNGVCPEGHGIMARARVSWDDPYFVERCPSCDGIWLDAGEWSRLGADLLLDQLDQLWLPSWRRRLRNEHERQQLETDLREKLGDDLYDRARDLGMTLASHPHGDVALAYVRELVRRHRPRRKDDNPPK
ncbi:MAG: zf-TFIIB domain-containing protein [Myxococcales bacterium]|nr:zf-TFIIB domain-containing protein [Myxococcales bacterium]